MGPRRNKETVHTNSTNAGGGWVMANKRGFGARV